MSNSDATSSASLTLRKPAACSVGPVKSTEPAWAANPAVVAVRADWRAMTVVHFALVFRGVAKIDAELLLDCGPERAVAYGCIGLDGSAAAIPARTTTPRKKSAVLDLDAEEEDGDNTPAPTSPMTDDSGVATATLSSVKDKGLAMLEALCKFCHTATGGGAGRRGVEKLVERVLETRDFALRVELLQALVDDAAESDVVRGAVLGTAAEPQAKGRRRPRGSGVGEVVSGVRVRAGAVDAKGLRYIWVRGMEGCASGRVEIRGKEFDGGCCAEGADVEAVADKLERARAPRADRQCGSWLREKVRKAEARAERVRAVAEARARKAEEAKLVGEVRIHGEVVTSEAFGRGRSRRTRSVVEYVEMPDSEEEEEEEPESESDDEGAGYFSSGRKRKRDDNDFVASDEDVMDESDAEIDEEDEDLVDDSREVAELHEDGDPDVELGARRARRSMASSTPRRAKVSRVNPKSDASATEPSSAAVNVDMHDESGAVDAVDVDELDKFAGSRRASGAKPLSGSGASSGRKGSAAESVSVAESDVDDSDFVVA